MIAVGVVGSNYGRTVLIPAFRHDRRCEVIALAGADVVLPRSRFFHDPLDRTLRTERRRRRVALMLGWRWTAFAAAVGRALRRSARVARKTARAHGTPIYIWRDGKVVAEKP